MNNFRIDQKTSLIFGAGAHKEVGKEVKKYADTCLIVDDGGAYLKDVLADVRASLEAEGIKYWELSGVRANPLLSKSNEGIELVKKNKIGFILAVGGGSVMDTGKYIAVATNLDWPLISFDFSRSIEDHDIIPHGAISTLSGTGSEFSNCSMMVDDSIEPNRKASILGNSIMNDFAIINPELTYTLPAFQTAAGASDIFSHCLENYQVPDPSTIVSDYYLEGVMKTVLKFAPIAVKDPTNYDARVNLCLAANMCMCTFMGFAGSNADWSVHQFENPITTQHHKTHGATLGIMTVAFFKWCAKNGKFTDKLRMWAVNVMGAREDFYSSENTILEGVRLYEDWLRDIGLPVRLREFDIEDDDELKRLAKFTADCNFGSVGMFAKLSEQDVYEIYQLAK